MATVKKDVGRLLNTIYMAISVVELFRHFTLINLDANPAAVAYIARALSNGATT